MGKTARWFRGLLGGKKAVEESNSKQSKRCGFVRLLQNRKKLIVKEKNGEGSCSYGRGGADPCKHEFFEPVMLPSSSRSRREDWAAVKIQAVFRGYLAKRALSALKGLVKLQALVRGYIVRKQALETLRCMHSLVRAQGRALASRSSHCSSGKQFLNNKAPQPLPGPATPEKCERGRSATLMFDGESFVTLPHDSPSKDSTTAQASILSPSSADMQSLSTPRFPKTAGDSAYETADTSPQFFSASSKAGSEKRGPFTPLKSVCLQSFLSDYLNYPNYMAETESSRARVRSQSAPKQRREFEKSGSTERSSFHGYCGDVVAAQSSRRSSSSHARFGIKGYPGSGQLDRLGMPIGYNVTNRIRY